MSDEDGGKSAPTLSPRQVEVIWEGMAAKRLRRTRELAELADINRSYLSEIVNRRTGPGLSAIHKLATALELPVAAFLPGADPDQAIAAARMGARLDPASVMLAPKIGRGVADTAGGGQIEDYPPQQLTPVPERAGKGHQLASGEVRGDCLAPDLEPGDTAIIAIHEARPGQIVAVTKLATGELFYKRFGTESGRYKLSPNPGKGESLYFEPEEINVVGVVIGRYRDVR
jgi:hypothetical protein